MAKKKGPGPVAPAGERTALLDSSVYSAEAVKLAAFVFSDRAEIKIRAEKKALAVTIGARGGSPVFGEFLNEALNQQCRIDLAGKNSKIAGIIVTKALLSAAGEK